MVAPGSSVLPARHLVPSSEVRRLGLQHLAEPCLTGPSMMARATKGCVITAVVKAGLALAREGAGATGTWRGKLGVKKLAIKLATLDLITWIHRHSGRRPYDAPDT